MKTCKIKRRLLTFSLCVVVLLSFLCVSAFAFSHAPTEIDEVVYIAKAGDLNQIVGYGFSSTYNDYYTYCFDFSLLWDSTNVRFVDISNDGSYNFGYWNSTGYYNATETQISNILDAYTLYKEEMYYDLFSVLGITGDIIREYSVSIMNVGDLTVDSSNLVINALDSYSSYTNSYDGSTDFRSYTNQMFNDTLSILIKDSNYRYNLGAQDGYSKGYTDGVNESDVGKNFLLTVFSVPSYVLSTIFNFEIFGINLYLLITFLLTIAIVGLVLKKIL